jgi:hypothetical protein
MIQRRLTLTETSRLTGGQLSTAQIHRMKVRGLGSPRAWMVIAEALAVPVSSILPAPGATDGRQLELVETR